MAGHILKIVALTAVLTACAFLPFLPGRYDAFAVTLSVMAQFFGVAGLLLVPVGVIWLVAEIRGRTGYPFAIAAMVVASLVAAGVSLGAFLGGGVSFGVVFVAFAVYALWRLAKRVGRLTERQATGLNPAPLYLIVVPAVVSIVPFSLLDRAADWSRKRAIDHTAQLIRDIEAYYARNRPLPGVAARALEGLRPTGDGRAGVSLRAVRRGLQRLLRAAAAAVQQLRDAGNRHVQQA